ncbi:MAG: HD domain-containing phosphohydrolase [Alphaproteobacteria bacterium]
MAESKSSALKEIETSGNPVAKMVLTAVVILIAAVVGGVAVFQFIAAEREREMTRWQVRMGIIADSRFNETDKWLDSQLKELRGIASNESVQLYMTILYDAEDGASGAASAEAEYLGNLLAVVADRAGFQADLSAPQVSANIGRTGNAGLALIDANGRLVVGSPGTPAVEGPLLAFVANAPKGKPAISDIFIGPGGKPTMAFLAPVFELQSDESAESQIAIILGVREIDTDLYPLLKQPGNIDETAEAVLVRQRDSVIEYLSPLKDGTKALDLKLSADAPDLAAGFAIRNPNGFALQYDYLGEEVLVTSRRFSQVPWTLVYKVNTSEALAESERRLNQMVIAFALIIFLVIIGGAALWYYGSSRRATEAAERFEKLASRFERQRNFMHLVTDSQPNSIVIYDEEGHYRWFNQVALDLSGLSRADLFEKHITAVIGPIEGKRIAGWVKECIEDRERKSYTHSMHIDGRGEIVYRSDLIYLEATETASQAALMVSQDITESVRERERREEVMRQLVGTLVSVVDQRDPFSANHSVRVGLVARAVAEDMELDPSLIETASVAGSLMNLGKITVPSEVLTKRDKLTEEEFRMIRDSVLVSAKLVEGIDFEGPVYQTLRQLQENVDGSGTPEGLSGEQIVITARIVALANAFVGMVSARAWRDGMPFDKAIDILLQDAGKKFDRRAVVALANYLDNRGGRDAWAAFGQRPEPSNEV